MAIRVTKLGEIVDGFFLTSGRLPLPQVDLAVMLTNLPTYENPLEETAVQFELIIGEGPAARPVMIDLPAFVSKDDPVDTPVFLRISSKIARKSLIYFRKRLFVSERLPISELEEEEVVLRVKKAVYEEEAELSSLRASVANLEAAIAYQKSGPKRDPIAEDVKLVVWARDGGACTRCGSQQKLHFDHIIPVIKGGGNSEENIQLLCQPCNLKKSDKIAVG